MTGPRNAAEGKGLKRRDGEWRLQANCAGASQLEQRQMTSAVASIGMNLEIVRGLAKKYCDGCPVRQQCEDWAMTEMYFTGIAGGKHLGWASQQAATRAGRRVRKLI